MMSSTPWVLVSLLLFFGNVASVHIPVTETEASRDRVVDQGEELRQLGTAWTSIQWCARVPAAASTDVYTFSYGQSVTSGGSSWSAWVNFTQADLAVYEKQYPNTMIANWPVVVTKLNVKGLSPNATSTDVEVQMQDMSTVPTATTTLKASLFGPALGIMFSKVGDAPVTMRTYNENYWTDAVAATTPPKVFPIVNRFIAGSDDLGEWQDGIAALKKIGSHGIQLTPSSIGKTLLDAVGENMTSWAVYSPPGGVFDYDLGNTSTQVSAAISDWAVKQATPFKNAGFQPGSVQAFALADEPGWYLPGAYLDLSFTNNANALARWTNFLKAQSLQPSDFGQTTWDNVVPCGRDAATTLSGRVCFYWSVRFFPFDAAQHFAQTTAAMQEAFQDPNMCIYANFNNFAGRMYVPGPVGNNRNKTSLAAGMQSLDWFEFGRAKGVSCLWTEDWFQDSLARQWSLYGARLGSAARLGGVTWGGYMVPRGSRGGNEFLQKALTIVGSGAKALKYFTFGPEYNFPSNCYSQNAASVFPTMAKAHSMIGKAESVLWPGHRPTSPVAIVYPRSSTVWDEWGTTLPHTIMDATNTNMYQGSVDYMEEVAGLYAILAQLGNIPVEFIDEGMAEDDTVLAGYKVLFLTQPDVPTKVLTSIVTWVQSGGVLFLSSGAGANDQYDQPTDVLSKAFGVVETPRQRLLSYPLIYPKVHVVCVSNCTVDSIYSGEGDGEGDDEGDGEDDGSNGVGDAYGVRNTFTTIAPTSVVLAQYGDNHGTAAVYTDVGHGGVIHFAYLPGISNHHGSGGGVDTASQIILNATMTALRRSAVDTATPMSFPPVVVRDGNAPSPQTVLQVESPMLTSSAGAAVTLLNWQSPLTNLTNLNISIAVDFTVSAVESVLVGALSFDASSPNMISVLLPTLEAADIITVT